MIWPVQIAGRETYLWERANRHMNALRPAFEQWRADFEQSPNGKIALIELEKLRSCNSRKFKSFREQILFTCWCAKAYGAYGIAPDDARQKAWKHLQRNLPLQVESVRSLVNFIKNNRYLSYVIIEMAFDLTKNLKKTTKEIGSTNSLLELLHNLETSLLYSQQGGWSTGPDRQWVACIDFGRSVRGRRRPEDAARVGLEFELALRFRLWTGGGDNKNRRTISNLPIPSSGNSNYRIIAMLLLATFEPKSRPSPERLQKEQVRVRDRINRFKNQYPDATYAGWSVLKDRDQLLV